MDPLAEKYRNISPYAYCVNNPVLYVDPDGKEIVIYYRQNNKEYSYKYSYEKGRKEGSVHDNKFLRNTVKSLDKLVSSGATRDLQVSGDKGQNCGDRILQIQKDKRQLSIVEVQNKSEIGNLYSNATYMGEKQSKVYGNLNGLGTIKFNDEFGVQINTSSGKYETNSPTAQLGHEILHEEHFKNDLERYENERGNLMSEKNRGGTPEEKLTTQEANQINVRLNEPIRNDYSGKGVKMNDPTINEN